MPDRTAPIIPLAEIRTSQDCFFAALRYFTPVNLSTGLASLDQPSGLISDDLSARYTGGPGGI